MRLLGNPLLQVAWLTARRRLRRVHVLAIATIVLVAAVIGLAASSIASDQVTWLLDKLTDYRWAVVALALVHSLFLTARVRREQKDRWLNSWMIAAPIPVSQINAWLVLRTLATVLIHLFAALSAVLLLAAASGRLSEALSICVLIAAAFLVGSMLGRYLPSKRQIAREDSRYAPRTHASHVVSADALSRWPIAQALSWHRPENARVALVVALFAVQGGSSMLLGLTVVTAWLLGIYLVTLMQATSHVGSVAAQWLRATPILFAKFAWPLARRVLVHQAIGSVTASVLGIAMGMPVITALYLLAVWLFIVFCVLCVSLADVYCAQQSRTKLALVVLSSIGIELRQHGWGLPWLLAISAWHVRRATSTRSRS